VKTPVKRPQPGKNKTIRTQRRKVIAKKLVEQIPPSKIAKQIGISRQMVNVEIRAPETQAFIKGMMHPHLPAISRMIPRALAAVNTCLKPSNEPINRLRAAKTLGYFMELAEGRKTDGNPADRPQRFDGTMEDLLVLYRKTTIEGSIDPPQTGRTGRPD
jgi:hypothetical protein